MKAEEIRGFIRDLHSDHRRYAVAEEVGLQTGYSHRRLDMMVLDCYESNGFRIDGYEIKVSRSDLRKELEDPEKHVAFFDVLDYFWLACPVGIVDLSIIPPKWGVMAFEQDGHRKILRRPLALHDTTNDRDVPRGFLASIVRAIQRREPAQKAIWDAYQSGRDDAKRGLEERLSYAEKVTLERAEKISEYEKLQNRFRTWGDNLNEKLDEFERFRSMPIERAMSLIKRAIITLEQINTTLGGITPQDEEEEKNDERERG